MIPLKIFGPVNANITPEQIKAARALVNLNQKELSIKAGVGDSTLADFERGKRSLRTANLNAVCYALQESGVIFLEGGVLKGPLPEGNMMIHQFLTIQDIEEIEIEKDACSS